MNRYAVLVDAGYLLSQSVQILSNKATKARKEVKVTDPQGLVGKLIEKASEALGNNQLLRVYWYDGVLGKLSQEQKAIALLPDVQLRQGTVNSEGAQKGVDSKIVADLIELSGNHAVADVMLVTGDGDLAIGIELAQRRGVRVAVLGIEEVPDSVLHNQSFEITSVADRVVRIGRAELAPYMTYSPVPVPTTPTISIPVTPALAALVTAAALPETPELDLAAVVDAFISEASPSYQSTVISATGSIEHAVDKKLLFAAYKMLGRAVQDDEKKKLRDLFRKKIKAI